MKKEIEIPEGYDAKIEDNKIIFIPKGSEDERIRKALRDIVRDMPYMETELRAHGLTIQKALAYLEKQNEDKDDLVYRLNGLMQDYIKQGNDDEEKEHRFKCYQLFWDALEDSSFFEQKEQKPAEWSVEDSRILYNVIAYVGYAAGQIGVTDDEFKEANVWLKALPERFNLQPKEEWSKDDEKALNCIITVLDRLGFEEYCKSSRGQDVEEERLYYSEIQVLKKLKSIHPQIHCKLSEKEIEHLYTLASFIKSRGYEDDGEFLEGVVDKLKLAIKEIE